MVLQYWKRRNIRFILFANLLMASQSQIFVWTVSDSHLSSHGVFFFVFFLQPSNWTKKIAFLYIREKEWCEWGLVPIAHHYWGAQQVKKACLRFKSYVLPTRQVCIWAHQPFSSIFAIQSVLFFRLGFRNYGEVYTLTLADSHQNCMKLLWNV